MVKSSFKLALLVYFIFFCSSAGATLISYEFSGVGTLNEGLGASPPNPSTLRNTSYVGLLSFASRPIKDSAPGKTLATFSDTPEIKLSSSWASTFSVALSFSNGRQFWIDNSVPAGTFGTQASISLVDAIDGDAVRVNVESGTLRNPAFNIGFSLDFRGDQDALLEGGGNLSDDLLDAIGVLDNLSPGAFDIASGRMILSRSELAFTVENFQRRQINESSGLSLLLLVMLGLLARNSHSGLGGWASVCP